MKVVKYILLLLFSIEFCGIAMGATYTNINDLPKKNNVYTLPEGDILEITGNVTVANNQTVVISAGSKFIVNGNVTIEEKGTLQLSSNSKTVINGDLYQDGHSPLGLGLVRVDIGDIKATNAIVVVTGSYDIWNNYEYSQGSYLDVNNGNEVYIYGHSDVRGLDGENEFVNKYGTINDLLNPSWPKCYDLEVVSTKEIINVCTDENGDLDINLNKSLFKGKGVIKIKEGTTIECRNFRVHNDNQYGQNMQLICDGSIICTGEFRVDQLAQNNDGSAYFATSCSAKIAANSIYIGYNYAIQPFKGVWLTEDMTIKNGQGQDIDFPECSYVKASEISIDANVSNGIIIGGHVISDKISSTKDIYLKYNGTASENAILTLGTLTGYHTWNNVKIIAEQYTVVNMCGNPVEGNGTIENVGQWNEHPNGADNIGYFGGYVLYNYGAGGWPNGHGPEEEWDINYKTTDGRYSSIKAKQVIAGYSSYADCIAELNMNQLLPIELVYFLYSNGEFLWETASETNNDYFVVEYSKNGKDWIECTYHMYSISSDGAQYVCMPNKDVANSVFSYFRLKQVDMDGKYSYSDIYTVCNNTASSPCDSEDTITLDGLKYRIYNGQLYYCEGDNE